MTVSKNTNKKILLIEDDKFLADLIYTYFKKHGLDLDWAIDGEEGLKKIKENRPSLILLDIILPGISGFEVLKKLKADSDVANIPVIILSNLGQADEIKQGLELGAEAFLVKAQFDLGEIVDKVKERLANIK